MKVFQLLSPNINQRSISLRSIGSRRMLSYQSIFGASLERYPKRESKSFSFDICIPGNVYQVKLDKPVHENRNEVECAKKAYEVQYLRPGMILLKKFICHTDQVNIVNKCRDLGIGRGGFYRPEYENGAKLNLQMMCLGKDWDLQTRLYKDFRSFDGVVPPKIPEELSDQVKGALHAAHKFLMQIGQNENEIPSMLPDICIVNFYNNSGRLGLHQDKDESPESLKRGLPVVSFSIGDSAEFLYSYRRSDIAEKVMLESGDVLIFGGESRHIFHGVSRIVPYTAPKLLTYETNLRSGRLNLTFRKF